ncbi:hypothetical protein, partial [Pantoea sp. B9002]|uniref:hypothetical protein n=1 Tax=Pantoea sp. B9002 TaxID=2726979 RepID=UPI001C4343B9
MKNSLSPRSGLLRVKHSREPWIWPQRRSVTRALHFVKHQLTRKTFQLSAPPPIQPLRTNSAGTKNNTFQPPDEQARQRSWRNSMNSWFGNISVNLKLGLGFGLVLVLTTILAL